METLRYSHLLVGLVLSLCLPVDGSAGDPCKEPVADEDAYAAYTEHMRSHQRFFGDSPVVVVSETLVASLDSDRIPEDLGDAVSDALVKRFNQVNQCTGKLERRFPFEGEYELLASSDLPTWFSAPATSGLPIRFSRVAFDEERERGLFLAQEIFNRGRHSYLIVVGKTEKGWIELHGAPLGEVLLRVEE